MRASSKRRRVDSSSLGAPPSPPPCSFKGDPAADAYIDPTAAAASPPLSTSDIQTFIVCWRLS